MARPGGEAGNFGSRGLLCKKLTPTAKAYWRDRPVDMMDKADALSTYPQAQQQQKDINLISKKNLAA